VALLNKSYRTQVRHLLKKPGIGEYLSYDKEGFLLLYGERVVDLASFGTPLEITDLRNMELRVQDWKRMTTMIAKAVGYTGGLRYDYATKAKPAAEVVMAAIAAGLNIEISGAIGAKYLIWLNNKSLLPENVMISANGLKIDPEILTKGRINIPWAELDDNVAHLESRTTEYYANLLSFLAQTRNASVVPIIDSVLEQLVWEKQELIPRKGIDTGLRLKLYGTARNDDQQLKLEARHGLSVQQMFLLAGRISRILHQRLTTFHAMVGAAEVIPVDDFVDTLLYAADLYFQIKKICPELTYFNMGGGMPPMSTDYQREAFLRRLFKGIKKLAKKYNMDMPVIVFEYGSYFATETGFYLTKIVETKTNSVGSGGEPLIWEIVDGPLMRMTIDMLVIGKKDFVFLAANNANEKAIEVKIGDKTCDGDGRWPTKEMGTKILVPKGDNQLILICGTGAYQEEITGNDGVGHSEQDEPGEVVIYTHNGAVRIKALDYPDLRQAITQLGYKDANLRFFNNILEG